MDATAPKSSSALFSLLPREQAQVYRFAQGTTLIWRPAPTVIVTRVEGMLTDDGAMAMETTMRRMVASDGGHFGFHDWEEMTDYTTLSRIRLTQACYEVRKITTGVHFILRSKIVAFGVQAANMVLHNLTVHPSRESFERTLREALRKGRAFSGA